MYKTISSDLLAETAGEQYKIAVFQKKQGNSQEALDFFRIAAQKYEELAERTSSTAKRLDYLEMQRECLRNTLANTFRSSYWIGAMLRIKDIADTVDAMTEEDDGGRK